MTDSIAERIAQIRAAIPPEVRLVAVTKTVSVEAIRLAYEAGVRDFGENRVQEAEAKQLQLQDLRDITWHLIGHLQSNKAATAIAHFDWLHSVDSWKLAQRLDRLAREQSRCPRICLQVKILPDPNKYGWTVPELLADLPQLNACESLNIQGLMTIPPQGLTETQTRSVFEKTRQLAAEIGAQNWSHIKMAELSMVCQGTYLLAVEAGATMIRPGQIIFGPRNI
ncbi:alanine racemase domain protein [Limnospira maxima CS-328]|uniref:Pyridoxal phosphate homeostasis protein n=1 Tax=Limnospira maxima CS-328 TaxID=513049 RepID=B5W8Z5_LIMMA|nr:YggS family pyridoxal phosphate-dependent enzyme [Limnospira maxima]EDZ91992.1 alanine racemase domain protein [Limnospira maxima CS-328]